MGPGRPGAAIDTVVTAVLARHCPARHRPVRPEESRSRAEVMSVASKPDVQPAIPEITATTKPAARRNVRPLLGLIPFVARYKGRAAAALVALVVAAIATLAVPIAVRRMIDYGFDPDRADLIDKYFGVMIVVVAVLAGASAMRYYLVTSIGER